MKRRETRDSYRHVEHVVSSCRVIAVIEDTYNMMLLALFIYFGILFAFYGFRIISVSARRKLEHEPSPSPM